MDQSEPQVPDAAGRARFGDREQVVIRLIVGLTALCLVGAMLAGFALPERTTDTPARKFYPPDLVYGVLAYDVTDPARPIMDTSRRIRSISTTREA